MLFCQKVLRKIILNSRKVCLQATVRGAHTKKVRRVDSGFTELKLLDLEASEQVVNTIVLWAFSHHRLIFLWQSHSDLLTFVSVVMIFLSGPWGDSSGSACCAAMSRVPFLTFPLTSWVIKLEMVLQKVRQACCPCLSLS